MAFLFLTYCCFGKNGGVFRNLHRIAGHNLYCADIFNLADFKNSNVRLIVPLLRPKDFIAAPRLIAKNKIFTHGHFPVRKFPACKIS